MSWIKVSARKSNAEEDLTRLGIALKDDNTFWAETYVRSEDISEFYAFSSSKVIILFFDENRPNMIIRSNIADFAKEMKALEESDYETNQDD